LEQQMNPSHQKEPDARGRRRSPIAAAALVVVVAVIAVVAADTSAASQLPVSPTFLDANHAYNGLQVEPATITYTGDGTGFLGGANVRDRNSGIHWTKWTPRVALGSGFNQLNNCNPDCAGGKFRGYRVKIELWLPRTLARTLVFTRMTIFYKKGRPSGEPRHYTFHRHIRRWHRRRLWLGPAGRAVLLHSHARLEAGGGLQEHPLAPVARFT
jgi:hypothetical protein